MNLTVSPSAKLCPVTVIVTSFPDVTSIPSMLYTTSSSYANAPAASISSPDVIASSCAMISSVSTTPDASVSANTTKSPLILISEPTSNSGLLTRPVYVASMSATCSCVPGTRPRLVIASIRAIPFGTNSVVPSVRPKLITPLVLILPVESDSI